MCEEHGNPNCLCEAENVSKMARKSEESKNSVLLKGLRRFAEEREVPTDPEETVKLQKSAGKIGWTLNASDMSPTDVYKASLLGNQWANRLCKYASDIGAYIPLNKAQEIGRLAAVFVMQNDADPRFLFTEKCYQKALEGKLDTQRTTDEYVSVISEVFSPHGGSDNYVNLRSPGMGPGKIPVEPGNSGKGPRTRTTGTSEESVETFTDRATDTRYPEGRGVQGRPFRVYDASNPPYRLATNPGLSGIGPTIQKDQTVPPIFSPEQIAEQKRMFVKMYQVPREELGATDYKTAFQRQEKLAKTADSMGLKNDEAQVPGTPHEQLEPGFKVDESDKQDEADAETLDKRAAFLEKQSREAELTNWAIRDALLESAKSLRAQAANLRKVSRFQGF